MLEWWNSIDIVSRLNNGLQVSIIVFGILTYIVTSRVDNLQDIEKLNMQSELKTSSDNANTAMRAAIDLEKKQKPRTLSEKDKIKLVSVLSAFPNSFIDLSKVSSGESANLSLQFREVFKQSGWNVSDISTNVAWDPVGIVILAQSVKIPRAIALQNVLNELGFNATGVLRAGDPEDYVGLVIGHKP